MSNMRNLRMRTVSVMLALVIPVASNSVVHTQGVPVQRATPILDEANRMAAAQLPQPTGQRGKGGKFWGGVGLLGAGAALAGMAATVAKTCPSGYFEDGDFCYNNNTFDFREKGANKPLMYGGIGAAAGGVVLMMMGRRVSPMITPAGGILIRSRISF
jgi:hypothetical protein